MKKILLIVISLLCITGCSKDKIEIKNLEDLQENIEDVTKVVAVTSSVSGKVCYDITESKTDLYMSLVGMELNEETLDFKKESTIIYVFYVNDQKYSFEFNNGNFVQDGKYYKVTRDNIKIDYLNETPCE